MSDDTGAQLRSIIERLETIGEEKKAAHDAEKDVYAEAQGNGFDAKILRKIIAMRKRNADDIAEEDAVLAMYLTALGMI